MAILEHHKLLTIRRLNFFTASGLPRLCVLCGSLAALCAASVLMKVGAL